MIPPYEANYEAVGLKIRKLSLALLISILPATCTPNYI
jgi:hypothetical protein